MLRSTRVLLLFACMFVLALFLGVGDAHAQLLSNTQFDTDVDGWPPFASATIAWDALDAEASPDSGSALVTSISATGGDGTGARQCASGVDGGHTYLLGAEVYFPGGQTETGWADLLVQWYSDAACSDQIGLANTTQAPSSNPDTWQPVIAMPVAPAASQSARVRLSVRKEEANGSLGAHFDNVLFALDVIFDDGFESGDTAAWSTTVP